MPGQPKRSIEHEDGRLVLRTSLVSPANVTIAAALFVLEVVSVGQSVVSGKFTQLPVRIALALLFAAVTVFWIGRREVARADCKAMEITTSVFGIDLFRRTYLASRICELHIGMNPERPFKQGSNAIWFAYGPTSKPRRVAAGLRRKEAAEALQQLRWALGLEEQPAMETGVVTASALRLEVRDRLEEASRLQRGLVEGRRPEPKSERARQPVMVPADEHDPEPAQVPGPKR